MSVKYLQNMLSLLKPNNITTSPLTEISCGGIVYQKIDQNYLFLLGKSSGYHKWILPKGRIEKGESETETALREIKEETSIIGKILNPNPIFSEKYIYFADFKNEKELSQTGIEKTRRVKVYQENGGAKTKVFKTVKYYLVKYISGDPQNHGWEMEDCAWFDFENALKTLAFPGQKKALKKANQLLNS